MNERGFSEDGQFGMPYVARGGHAYGGAPQRAPAKQANLFVMVHRCLRGRYHIAILIGVLLAAPIATGA